MIWTDEMDLMVRNAISDGRIDITTLYGMQLVICYQTLKYYMCRGIDEMTFLRWTRFCFGTYDVKGILYGLPMVQLHHDVDKTHQISISKPTVRAGKHRLIYVHNKKDPQCYYTNMLKYRAMCPPNQDRFFCHASTAAMQQRYVNKGQNPFLSSMNQPVGKEGIGQMVKNIAELAGVQGFNDVTNHTIRAYGITRMNNSANVSLAEAMGVARHQSVEAHSAYIKTTGESEANRIMAQSDVPH